MNVFLAYMQLLTIDKQDSNPYVIKMNTVLTRIHSMTATKNITQQESIDI